MDTTRRAAIYCRISQDRGGDQLGVQRQEEACRDLARARAWEVVDVFVDDDISAFSGKRRPAYEAMFEAVKAGEVDAIVSWAPARLTRHPRELEDLIDLLDAHRVAVATYIAGDYDLSTSGGRLTARVVGSVARHESEEKSERVKLKMAELSRAGKWKGGKRPYGYEADGVTVVPEEAEVVRFMARRALEGLGLRRVQGELEAAGILSATGKPWAFNTIKDLLTSPRIAGLASHKGEVVGPAEWPAIVDEDTWAQVRATLTDPRRKHQRPARYLLTGLLFSTDGGKMTGGRAKGRPGERRRVYRLPGHQAQVDAAKAEAAIVEYVLRYTDGAVLPRTAAAPKEAPGVADLEAELDELAGQRGRGEISLREWVAARTPLQARLSAARKQVPAVRVPAGVTAALGTPGGLRAAWPSLNLDQQRRALGAVLERVVVKPHRGDLRVFDPERFEFRRRY